jgi:hypothetical protein
MTTAADDSASEEAFEAYLAGKPVPEPGATLAAFAGAVRATATQPGRPNAALAELLATGLLVDQPPLSARTAKRRRRRMWFITAIFAKIASAGAIAQAATGAGIVLVGFTGVGAAGALPTPVQHGFATVVAAITPLSPSDGSPAAQPAAAQSDSPSSSSAAAPAADSTETAGTETDSTDTASTETDSTDTASTDTAASATSTPKNHGQLISSLAHERNAARKAAHKAGSDDSAATATSAPSTESAGSDGESSDDSGKRSSGSQDGGHGNSQKSGH